jgi:hypothetical protein
MKKLQASSLGSKRPRQDTESSTVTLEVSPSSTNEPPSVKRPRPDLTVEQIEAKIKQFQNQLNDTSSSASERARKIWTTKINTYQ